MNDERQWGRGWRPVLVGLALVTASAGVWAVGPAHGVGGPMGPMEGAGERMVEHWMRGLDLQPAQREQLQTLAQAARADMQPLRQEGRALREERQRLLAAPALDEAALEALRQRELAWHDRLTARMNRFMIDAAKVLTPEQRQRWAERMQQRAEGKHRPGMGPHERPHHSHR
ncbi:Spy/CpxP family protein refolding chaperone [Tepidimonas sp. HKU79]|uniref:Spy/CpxP family protein refolding chaperone n=1 Tax=Tepidimonas sp. HKU79 TaxID=3414505 RepID=UPI003C7C5F36